MAIRGVRRTQASFVGFHVVFPVFALFDIGGAELPILLRLVDAGEKALALLVLGQVEEELDDARPIGMEMSFQIGDRTVAIVPEVSCGRVACREAPPRGEAHDARGRSAPPRNRIG
jgi:hypothetical protein